MTEKRKKQHRRDITVGHRQRVSVYASSKRELNQKCAALLAEVHAGTFVLPNSQTVEEVSKMWLPYHVALNELTDSTRLSYEGCLNAHIVPLLGSLRVQELTEEVITRKLANRSYLSSSMRRKIFLTLHLVLKYARRKGLITKDPMEFMRAPTQRNESDRDMHCLNREQAAALFVAAGEDRLCNLFRLLLLTGARQGELLALRVDDIVEDFGLIRIRRTLSDSGEGGPRIKNETKTSAGRRDIPLGELARQAVLDEIAVRMREGRQKHELLFSSKAGTFHLRQNIMRRHFRPVLRRAKLDKGTRVHDLRHSYATLALSEGVSPHLVSKLMGHSSIKVTIDLYGHALREDTVEAARMVNGIFADSRALRAQSAG